MSAVVALKHWFVPHRGNRHQPRLLHGGVLSLIAAGLIIVQLAYNFSATDGQVKVLGYAANVRQSAVISLTNRERAAAGLSSLRENQRLNDAARRKAEDMFAKNYWDHIAPDGTEPWYFFESAGYDYLYAGENLAMGFNTSPGVVAGWMASPGHKANILNPNYQDIGIAVLNGTLLGEETTLVVAHYGQVFDAEAAPASNSGEQDDLEVAGALEPAKQAPTPRDYSATRPLSFTQTLGWGQLLTIGTLTTLIPVYATTHMAMIRYQLHKARRWLWRRRLIELTAILSALLGIVLSGLGSVG